MTTRKRQTGLTAIELMVSVALATLLLAIGGPSFNTMLQGNRTVANANTLIGTLHAARSEALKVANRVTVCKSSDQATCDNSLEWQAGWISFVDNDADGVRDTGGTPEVLLRIGTALDGSDTLTSVAFADWISFRADGMVLGSDANTGSFVLCSEVGAQQSREVSLVRTGGLSTATAADEDCP